MQRTLFSESSVQQPKQQYQQSSSPDDVLHTSIEIVYEQGAASSPATPVKSAPVAIAVPETAAQEDNVPHQRWRLHFCMPTIDIDVGRADYATTYSRWLSFEYLFAIASVLYVLPYGYFAIKHFCDNHLRYYHYHLRRSAWLMRKLGAVGYDSRLDKQFNGFAIQLPIFLALAVLLMLGSMLLRRCSVPSSALSDSIAVHASDSFRDDVAEAPKHAPLAATCSRRWRVCARMCVSPSLLRSAAQRLLGQKWVLPLFYSIVGLIFFAVVHGPHFFLPLLLILANYLVFSRLQRWCPYRVFMTIMWATHLGLLYLVEMYRGFEEVYWLQYYFPTHPHVTMRVLGKELTTPRLWKQRMRWYVAFRMTTLRLIAFNYDLWEATHSAARARQRATDKHDTACVECAQLREQNSASANAATGAAPLPAEASRCYKYRTEHARDLADYSLVNYLAYVVFPPLYLAGPMSSFNAFVSYMRVPSTAMPLRKMAVYALRILGIYATEYVLLNFVHVVALSSYPFLILEMNILEQTHFLLYSLAYIWLKFSFIWKSSRLFAMLSGIEVPEDMRRCFSNTFSVRDFWRDWHASFNLWIVRYMYIPMGGRARVALSILPIFLFIALWHDPALHLVKWALCIAAMFVVELVVSACFGWVAGVFRREMADAGADVAAGAVEDGRTSPGSVRGVAAALLRPAARFTVRHLSPRVRAWCYRMLRVLGGMCTVFGLIVANLIGFSMQNSSAATLKKIGVTEQPADAEDVISRALQSISTWYALSFIFSMFIAASLAVLERDLDAAKDAWLRAQYKLKQ